VDVFGVLHELGGVVVDVSGTALAVELVDLDAGVAVGLLVLQRVFAVRVLGVVPHLRRQRERFTTNLALVLARAPTPRHKH